VNPFVPVLQNNDTQRRLQNSVRAEKMNKKQYLMGWMAPEPVTDKIPEAGHEDDGAPLT
jgi:hypothetical protein